MSNSIDIENLPSVFDEDISNTYDTIQEAKYLLSIAFNNAANNELYSPIFCEAAWNLLGDDGAGCLQRNNIATTAHEREVERAALVFARISGADELLTMLQATIADIDNRAEDLKNKQGKLRVVIDNNHKQIVDYIKSNMQEDILLTPDEMFLLKNTRIVQDVMNRFPDIRMTQFKLDQFLILSEPAPYG